MGWKVISVCRYENDETNWYPSNFYQIYNNLIFIEMSSGDDDDFE